MDVNTALREGPSFLRNAEDALAREITNPDLLYMWDNQVAAIDRFLADTEPHVTESADLAELRTKLRTAKRGLERKIIEFEAKQEGEEAPEDPSPEELAADFVEIADEVIEMADQALKQKVKDVKDLDRYENPRDLINGFLADSEVAANDPALQKKRAEVRQRKDELEVRIRTITDEWRKKDIAASA
jgi:hypothetical protein